MLFRSTLALAQHRTVLNAQRASTVLLKKEMSGVSSSFEVANSRRASQSSRPETSGERYRDEEETGEREEEESHVAGGEGYYGYETSSRMRESFYRSLSATVLILLGDAEGGRV